MFRVSRFAGLSALVLLLSAQLASAQKGYTFSLLHSLGDPLPGIAGGVFVNDFEPGAFNNHGDVAFGADASTGGEAVFIEHNGHLTELARSYGPAPGGGVFEFGFLGTVGLNDLGDVV